MSKNRTLSSILTLTLALVACQPTTSPTTTDPGSTTTSTPASTTPGGRAIEEVDCDHAPDEVAIVCEAYDLIKRHYVDEISDEVLADGAVEALEGLANATGGDTLTCALPTEEFSDPCDVAAGKAVDSADAAEVIVAGLVAHSLDPNSAYFDQRALQLLEQEQQGEIEGIGALVSPEDETIEGDNKQCSIVSETCRIVIVSTIEGAPAEAAGLQRDDVIVGVDGESIAGWSIDEVTSRVRGPAGTDVLLSIEREGSRFDVSIVRAAVEIPVIDSEMVGDVGYIRLRLFSSNADEQFDRALVDLLESGAERLVIDLRDNPGGLLDTAIEVTSIFLPEGDVVVTESPEDRRSYPVTGDAIVPDDMEVIIVVNRGSASASEVVSAVLQETHRAVVVGEATFGKNTVQQRFSLSNGGALKLTIARWLTPGGHDFGGVGVIPDVELSIDPGLDTETLVASVLAAS